MQNLAAKYPLDACETAYLRFLESVSSHLGLPELAKVCPSLTFSLEHILTHSTRMSALSSRCEAQPGLGRFSSSQAVHLHHLAPKSRPLFTLLLPSLRSRSPLHHRHAVISPPA